MLSTYLGYQLYGRDPAQSLARVASEPVVQTAATYYDANIGKVKNVDDFINNYRLFSYAMSAYGLSDLTYAKALMKQVLTSDLSDSTSVANKLNDPRYRAFAQAFGFTTKGAVATPSVQSSDQQTATVAAFKANTTSLDQTTVDQATSYYQSHIGAITSVAGIENDTKLYSFVLTAYGLDASTTSKAAFESIVEGGLADPKSEVNTSTGAGYAALQSEINVSSTGTASTVVLTAQSSDAMSATVAAYAATAGTGSGAQAAATAESAYYESAVPKLTTATDLLKDNRLVAYVIKAFNLPSTVSSATLQAVLTSDLSNPTSVANTMPSPGYKQLAASFNFNTDGTLKTTPFQLSSQVQDTVALYTARQSSDTTAVDAATQYYKAHIGSVKTVGDLEHNTQLYNYVMTAYGLPSTTSQATVEQVLEADPASPTGILATTPHAHDLSLARAFSVDTTGQAVNTQQIQGADALASTTSAYIAAAKSDAASQTAATQETAYYKTATAAVTSVGSLLSDSRLVAYIDTAFAMPTGTSTDHLRQVLTTSATDAAKLNAADKKLWQAFDFGTTGLVGRQPAGQAQSSFSTAATDASYVEQAMEDEAGSQNTGIQLALYFKRMAPTITSAYSILADKALLQFTQRVLGLSSTSSQADVDVQAQYITSKLNLADLKNPAKLNQLIQRFAASYDAANPTDTTSIALLFGGSSS